MHGLHEVTGFGLALAGTARRGRLCKLPLLHNCISPRLHPTPIMRRSPNVGFWIVFLDHSGRGPRVLVVHLSAHGQHRDAAACMAR